MASITQIKGSDFSTYDNGEYTKMRGVATSSSGN